MTTAPHIEVIRDSYDAETRQARHDWAEVTGEMRELSPAVLLDRRTGWRYSGLVGAIGYPTGMEPGCMIVLGIQSQPEPRIVALEYREHRSVYELISDAVSTREQYGFGLHRGIIPDWIGDPDRYQAVIAAASVALEKKIGHNWGLYVREPADWGEQHNFPMYLWQLRSALEKDFLRLNSLTDLISRLQAMSPDAVDKGKTYDFPAVGMLGAAIHTLMIEKPWEQDIDHGKPIIAKD